MYDDSCIVLLTVILGLKVAQERLAFKCDGSYLSAMEVVLNI